MGLVVLLEDGEHPSNLGAVDRDLGRNKRVERRLQTEQVKEGTSRVRVVAREGKERVLAMEKDDGVVVREKVLRRGRSAGTCKAKDVPTAIRTESRDQLERYEN